MGRALILGGLVMVAAGLAIVYGVPLGRLPGDFTIRRGGFTLYVPLASCILVSVLLTLVSALISFFTRR
jgi:predicted MFS family arabinose efflux permease